MAPFTGGAMYTGVTIKINVPKTFFQIKDYKLVSDLPSV